MESLHDNTGNRKYLNRAERRIFYEIANAITDRSIRSFCLTLFHTGCRISEALALTGGKVDLSERTLVFRTLKQRKAMRFRSLPVPESLLMFFREKPVLHEARIWNFSRTTGYEIIKDCMKRAGIEGSKATPKGLRHGFAIACVSHGVPVTTLQKWMGHTKLSTTAIYLDLVGEDERRMAKAVWEAIEKTES